MLRSLYSGVSGLQNHQVGVDVIGVNIANINTNAYKKGRVMFKDMLYQSMQGASSPNQQRGGVNPKQVGLGVQTGSIDTIMSQGNFKSTGRKTDLGIQGNGFFVLREGDKQLYTRTGNYILDRDGTLVNANNGLSLQGWLHDEKNGIINPSSPLKDIKIEIGKKQEAKATQDIYYACNLDSRTNIPQGDSAQGTIYRSSVNVFDMQGNENVLEFVFTKVGHNRWSMKANMDDIQEGSLVLDVGGTGRLDGVNESEINLNFDEKGMLSSLEENSGLMRDVVNEGKFSVNLKFIPIKNGVAGEERVVKIHLGEKGNLDGITQFSDLSTTKAVSQNGYTMGYLESFNIDQNGIVNATYTNGEKAQVAQIALAQFSNPEGLEKIGDTNFSTSNNSGDANIGSANLQGRGSVVAGVLEMSNVSLSEEFTDLIVMQRGFQANSKGITTSDQLLQELLTLKR